MPAVGRDAGYGKISIKYPQGGLQLDFPLLTVFTTFYERLWAILAGWSTAAGDGFSPRLSSAQRVILRNVRILSKPDVNGWDWGGGDLR
jgi:hypothetical protein